MNLVMKHPVRRNTCALACSIILCLTLIPLSSLRAQAESKRPGPLFAGMRVGYSPDNIAAFSRGPCTRKEQLADWFVGVRLHRCLAATTNIMYHDDFDAMCAVEAPEPPIPPHGPYTRSYREFEAGIQKYPYYSSEIDVIAEPLPAHSVVSLRLLAGCGWIWTKDIPMWLAGVGFAAGDERLRFVLDIKEYRFEVPYEKVTYHYQDGVLVDRHAVGQHTNEHPLAIMAGLEFAIPWHK